MPCLAHSLDERRRTQRLELTATPSLMRQQTTTTTTMMMAMMIACDRPLLPAASAAQFVSMMAVRLRVCFGFQFQCIAFGVQSQTTTGGRGESWTDMTYR